MRPQGRITPKLRRQARIWAALIPLVCASLACKSFRESLEVPPPYPPMQDAQLGNMVNVFSCGPLWFGSAPTLEDLDLASRRGLEMVLSVCTPREDPDFDLAAECEALGLEFVDLGGSQEELSDEQVDRGLREIETSIQRALSRADSTSEMPDGGLLVFCGDGSRSAVLVAIHRAALQGVPIEKALLEARRAGMKPGESEDFVRSQVGRIRDQGTWVDAGASRTDDLGS